MDRWEEEQEDEGEKGSSEAKALPLSTLAVAPPQCSSFLGRHSGVGGKEKPAGPIEKVLLMLSWE